MRLLAKTSAWRVSDGGVSEHVMSDSYFASKAEALHAYADLLDRKAARAVNEMLAAKAAAAKARANALAAEREEKERER